MKKILIAIDSTLPVAKAQWQNNWLKNLDISM